MHRRPYFPVLTFISRQKLGYRLDGDSIRDLFHSEMDTDDYFDKKTKQNADAFDAESWGSHRWHT
jgi:hypothetical protein